MYYGSPSKSGHNDLTWEESCGVDNLDIIERVNANSPYTWTWRVREGGTGLGGVIDNTCCVNNEWWDNDPSGITKQSFINWFELTPEHGACNC